MPCSMHQAECLWASQLCMIQGAMHAQTSRSWQDAPTSFRPGIVGYRAAHTFDMACGRAWMLDFRKGLSFDIKQQQCCLQVCAGSYCKSAHTCTHRRISKLYEALPQGVVAFVVLQILRVVHLRTDLQYLQAETCSRSLKACAALVKQC